MNDWDICPVCCSQMPDDNTRPATALIKGECIECETCNGTGARGYSCPCRRHGEDFKEEA